MKYAFAMFCRSALVAALLITPAAALAAGEPQAGSATVPFRALGADGQPVADLKVGDVSLKVDGKAREIKSFELVDMRKTTAPGDAPAAKSDVPPPFATNAGGGGGGGAAREVFLLVDEESIAIGKDAAVKEAIGHLLGTLGAQDRVSLLSVRQGGPNIAPTNDLTKVKATIGTLAGYGFEQPGSDLPHRARDSDTAGRVHQLAGGRGASDGRVLLVGGGGDAGGPDGQDGRRHRLAALRDSHRADEPARLRRAAVEGELLRHRADRQRRRPGAPRSEWRPRQPGRGDDGRDSCGSAPPRKRR